MTVAVTGTTIEVLGKTYQLKCAPEESAAIHQAAQFLEEKMQTVRAKTHLLSIDRIAVLAALSIAHEMLALEKTKSSEIYNLNERLQALQNKVETALARCAQLELTSAE
jgi:cell division protein ZapA